MLKIKRVYDSAEEQDGYRILVDRLWPRGVSKEKADIGLWAKDIAPTPQLRKDFGHEPEKFPAFLEQYTKELEGNPSIEAFVDAVRERLAQGNVTLVYGARDTQHNDAVVLEAFLEQNLAAKAGKE
ncbi:MAG: DUF488 domain-containing protein [Christensenella sp.]|uniref:DUF488 domain-containing protein n=1 Tax=Christensenella sp. TaxID=1935934 RepID=UPI002B1EC051|nr:DUF488 domain-containing protein [Christensenella sp.]MEA5003572.1 DUF488 domain-containing protein [Christensenella sp.]